jgi:hypothetical protein
VPRRLHHVLAVLALLVRLAVAEPPARTIAGVVHNEKGEVVVGARVIARYGADSDLAITNSAGRFSFSVPNSAAVQLRVEGKNIVPLERTIPPTENADHVQLVVKYSIGVVQQSVVITAQAADPAIDRRDDAIYKNTLFLRDDQLIESLGAGINAGQHEGGGKSLEIRRYGFNLDHGGANGGLKILVDDVPQNQATQAHGEGYLGSLKSLSPELVEDVDVLNGPFSAEYGDFSALGVVHIRQRQSLEDRITLRAQGGSFGSYRTFAAISPRWENTDSFLALEHSYTDGPFKNPLHYTRDNVTANWTRTLSPQTTFGIRGNAGRNDFDSSGQLPLDLVSSGSLDRFGTMDPSDGGHARIGTLSAYYKNQISPSETLRLDGYVNRSLFDLFSNFTFFLYDPVHGDEIQQHDSRLQDGGSAQYIRSYRLFGRPAVLITGTNVADSWINVDLWHTADRHIIPPVGGKPWTDANVHITNPAVYAQQAVDFPRVHFEVGLRMDDYRFNVNNRLDTSGAPTGSAVSNTANVEPKINVIYTPAKRLPISFHLNYGRTYTSLDARSITQDPKAPKTSATDFYMIGTSQNLQRFSASLDAFLIDRQHETVYNADDGTLQFQGPSRSYGWEVKTSAQLTAHLSWNAGLTQVSNAFYRGTSPRQYVDSAPHTVANSSLTLNAWHGFFASLRYRHVSHYLLVNPDEIAAAPAPPYVNGMYELASGLDVIDFAVSKKLTHGIELNFSADNVADKRFYETQNLFNSRISPSAPAQARVHGTPGYPFGFSVGLTWRME